MNSRFSKKPGADSAPAIKAVGKVRRSQVISTYGIGAIVDLEAGSFMGMGLDDWSGAGRAGSLITESRLQLQLGVDHFRLPPVATDVMGEAGMVDARATLPAIRFPEWQECPRCHRLGRLQQPFEQAAEGSRIVCRGCGPKAFVNPVRFVVACRRGHIEEFPWEWWVHGKQVCSGNPRLFLRSHGKSSSLGDLFVQCDTCKQTRSMADAYGEAGMQGRKCNGTRPWLYDRVKGCEAPPRVIQRGASNVYFPVIASSISIPPASEAAFQVIEENWVTLKAIPESAMEAVLAGVSEAYGIDLPGLLRALESKRSFGQTRSQYTDLMGRYEEYVALCETRHDDTEGGFVPQFRNTVSDVPDRISGWFDLVGAVSRLREVRALAAFARIEPHPVSTEQIASAISEGYVSPLSKRSVNWLPAAEIRGEGIFLRFRAEAIDSWIQQNAEMQRRADILEEQSARLAFERGYTRDYKITPRLLLVHSFSHALIRQLSMDCGYSSSALRERLYVSDSVPGGGVMNGVLIYTGSPDSEGSLGGLVRNASPKLLEGAVLRVVESTAWCGSDPVCLETDPRQAGERISGAACHCCLLVPETACEKFNRELDRTFLVGDSERLWRGFFEEEAI